MTFQPVLPAALLAAAAVVVVAIRALSLRAALQQPARMRSVLRWAALTLAALFMVLAAARPGFPVGDARATSVASAGQSDVNVFFVVDRSVNSRVEDFGQGRSRMSGMRSDMAALIEKYPHARFAVISFSSRASVDWPLSDDAWGLKPMVAGLSAYTSETPDAAYQVNAAAASDVLRYKLYQAQQQFPRSTSLVFYLGEGAGGSRVPQGSFDLGSAKVAGGAVLGYGSAAGGPVPQEVADGNVIHAVDARTGVPMHSAINEPALTAIAGQLGVPYVHRDIGQAVTTAIPDVEAGRGGVLTAGAADRTELYWLLTLPAAMLTLTEIYLLLRRFRRNRVARRDVAL